MEKKGCLWYGVEQLGKKTTKATVMLNKLLIFTLFCFGVQTSALQGELYPNAASRSGNSGALASFASISLQDDAGTSLSVGEAVPFNIQNKLVGMTYNSSTRELTLPNVGSYQISFGALAVNGNAFQFGILSSESATPIPGSLAATNFDTVTVTNSFILQTTSPNSRIKLVYVTANTLGAVSLSVNVPGSISSYLTVLQIE